MRHLIVVALGLHCADLIAHVGADVLSFLLDETWALAELALLFL
jgi:hypothetical protein